MPEGGKPNEDMVFRITANTAAYCLFAAPSIKYVLLCYIPVSLVAILWIVLEHLETGDPLFTDYLGKQAAMAVILAVIWYILQRRELERFFQQ